MNRQSSGVRFKSHLKELLWSRGGKIGQLDNVRQIVEGRSDVEKKSVGVCRSRMRCVSLALVVFELDLV